MLVVNLLIGKVNKSNGLKNRKSKWNWKCIEHSFFHILMYVWYFFFFNVCLFNPKRNQSWIFIGRVDAEVLILWLPDAKGWLTGKDPDGGKDWRQEEKGTTEDEMAGRHDWLNGRELSKLWEIVKERQGGLVCCSPPGHKESDTSKQLNNSS